MRWVLAVAAAMALGLPASGAAAQPLPLSWAAPFFVDHQPPYDSAPATTTLGSVACVSASECVAGSPFGDIASSSDVMSGPSGWHIAHIDNAIAPGLASGVDGMACPSSALCVGVDSAGDILSSRSPFASAPSWSVARVESVNQGPNPTGLSAVSCASIHLCVAVDSRGGALTSTNPAGGGRTWHSRSIDLAPGGDGLTGISCPSPSLCVAVDSNGQVVTSSRPTQNAWHVAHVDGANVLNGISCPSASLCVGVDGTGVITSTAPTGGAGSWQRATIEADSNHRLDAVSCPSETLCVALDQAGNAFTSTDPTGGEAAWQRSPVELVSLNGPAIPGRSGLTAISCPSTGFCLAVDSQGNEARTTNPGGASPSWTVDQIAGSNSVLAAACPGSSCVAVDASGNVLTSNHPANPDAWTVARTDTSASGSVSRAAAASCPSSVLCAVVDGTSRVLVSRGGSWTSQAVDPGHELTSISCPTDQRCVAVDDAGDVVSSDDGAASWAIVHADPDVTTDGTQAALEDISCPSAGLCVAVDNAGDVLASAEPTGPASSWSSSALAGTLRSVSCAPGTISCVASGATTVLASRSPLSGPAGWSSHAVSSGLSHVVCLSSSYCTAIDADGKFVSSQDPWASRPAWTMKQIEPWFLTALSCTSPSWCIAFDGIGDALIAHPLTPRQLLAGPLSRLVHPSQRIGSLLAHGGYRFSFSAPIKGRLNLTWRAHRTIIGRARATFRAPGRRRISFKLTSGGKRLLAGARRLRLRASASFSRGPVSVSRSLILHA